MCLNLHNQLGVLCFCLRKDSGTLACFLVKQREREKGLRLASRSFHKLGVGSGEAGDFRSRP